MTSVTLQAEIDWIRANVRLYDSDLHAEAVIQNITKRYQQAHIIRVLQQFKETGFVKYKVELFELLEQ